MGESTGMVRSTSVQQINVLLLWGRPQCKANPASPLKMACRTALLVLLFACPTHSAAQEALQDPTLDPEAPEIFQGESLADRFDRIHRAPGFAAGPFTVTGRADLSLGYDTNIFDSEHRAKDDGVVVAGAGINAVTQTPTHYLDLDGFVARTTYFDTSSNDVWSGRVSATGWSDVNSGLRLAGSALVAREVERRDDPQSSPETEPVSYWHYQAASSLETRNALITFRGGLSFDRVDYDDVDSTLGKLNLDYRNMNEIDMTGRASYNASDDHVFYLEAVGNVRLPDDNKDIFGVDRQSAGFLVSGTADYAITELLRLVATVGYRTQYYEDSNVNDVSGPAGSMQLLWQPTDTTEVRALFSHDFYESFDLDTPGYWLDIGRISLAQQIKRDIIITGEATIGSRAFTSSSRSEQFYTFEASVKWGAMPGLVVSLDNVYEIQTANADNGSFNSNVTFLRVTKSF